MMTRLLAPAIELTPFFQSRGSFNSMGSLWSWGSTVAHRGLRSRVCSTAPRSPVRTKRWLAIRFGFSGAIQLRVVMP